MLLVEVRFSGQRRFAEWKLDLLLRSWGWLLPGFGSGLALVRLKRARLYRHTRHSCVVSCKEKPLPQSLVPSSLSTPSSYSPLLSFQKSKKKKKERKKETSSLCDREKDLFRFIFSTWRDLKKKNNKRTCNPGPRVGIGEEEGEESPLCLLREGVPKPFGARRWGDGNRRGAVLIAPLFEWNPCPLCWRWTKRELPNSSIYRPQTKWRRHTENRIYQMMRYYCQFAFNRFENWRQKRGGQRPWICKSFTQKSWRRQSLSTHTNTPGPPRFFSPFFLLPS